MFVPHMVEMINVKIKVFLLHASTNDVQQFSRDGLLTCLVVGEVELLQQVVSVVGGGLHGNHACCMFTCETVEQGGVDFEVERKWNQFRSHGLRIWFNDEIGRSLRCGSFAFGDRRF